jgi:hypothetical protein
MAEQAHHHVGVPESTSDPKSIEAQYIDKDGARVLRELRRRRFAITLAAQSGVN